MPSEKSKICSNYCNVLSLNDIFQLIAEVNRVLQFSKTIIDYVAIDNISGIISFCFVNKLTDHYLVACLVSSESHALKNKCVYYRDIRKLKIDLFNRI